jgi:hypothetical protein
VKLSDWQTAYELMRVFGQPEDLDWPGTCVYSGFEGAVFARKVHSLLRSKR